MSTPKPNGFYDGKGRWRIRKHGRAYTPALDQCPMTGRERAIRQHQNLLLRMPNSADVRRRYYELLAGPIPPDSRQPIEQVIGDRLQAIKTEHRYNERVTRWARRITRLLYRVGWYR